MGMRTGQDKTWTAHRVSSLRRVRGIHAYRSAEKDGEWLTASEAAKLLRSEWECAPGKTKHGRPTASVHCGECGESTPIVPPRRMANGSRRVRPQNCSDRNGNAHRARQNMDGPPRQFIAESAGNPRLSFRREGWRMAHGE